jgi:flagellar biogenesis protein FliO
MLIPFSGMYEIKRLFSILLCFLIFILLFFYLLKKSKKQQSGEIHNQNVYNLK